MLLVPLQTDNRGSIVMLTMLINLVGLKRQLKTVFEYNCDIAKSRFTRVFILKFRQIGVSTTFSKIFARPIDRGSAETYENRKH